MRTLIRKAAAIAVAATMATAVATPARAGGGAGHFKIVEVYMTTDGSMAYVIGDDGSRQDPDRCGGAGMYVIERATLGPVAFDRMVATMNAAMLANKRVTTWLQGCTVGSYWGSRRPAMMDFRVYRD